ncbi:hypothetical protein N474_24335 [Pseudoalteromonas luteoviolacea CPMOR-2]|uniref:PA14 domain-containing protein n=1 Tax=Pseudoalteromonas luteoviolacea DSM 6061 TaxID=1365250 RepID=A0A166VGT3_9GAMM|nr:hypothetical protein [Pseudoalteromonas luteoviolacea]KZN32713.1 hypothetical protein N475_21335 [Pseudoalteromonas luteoviolacea DSM 6061]KZN50833.1 hypothetical protein N474_24335 [Pseudoalteromonas luteoviolacea CPMOR-2]MBE0387127.1 hypothetical protein [Pseudoalteromonas luteoviolacea DSM 6061]
MRNLIKAMGFIWLSVGWSVCYATSVLIPVNASWKYYDLPQPPNEEWVKMDFDDSGWSSGKGQLGYGEGDEQTILAKEHEGQPVLAHYFRHKFSFVQNLKINELKLRLVVDDGVRIYLNGVEVHRRLLAESAKQGGNFALGSLIEHSWYEVVLDSSITLKRDNIVAVEVRQVSSNSSDLSFNLELIAE